MRIAFFGHNAFDAAVRRRITSFQAAKLDVTGFTMRREHDAVHSFTNVDLGHTIDANMAQRMVALVRAIPIVWRYAGRLRTHDVFWARNLEMLMLAWLAKIFLHRRARLFYECLDIHRLMHRTDLIGAMMRGLEGLMLNSCEAYVISSPAFDENHFKRHHPKQSAKMVLIENRLGFGLDLPERPTLADFPLKPADAPITIGWFGVLRCKRTLALLMALADKAPDRVRIVMRGTVSRPDVPHLPDEAEKRANVSYGGPYKNPDDLAAMYAGIDLIWLGDFHDPGANSQWLLPNRLYEGGYFGGVFLAPTAAQTGHWVREHGLGFEIAEPLETSLAAFILNLSQADIVAARASLMAADRDLFAQDQAEILRLFAPPTAA